jgi:hypothetical protein
MLLVSPPLLRCATINKNVLQALKPLDGNMAVARRVATAVCEGLDSVCTGVCERVEQKQSKTRLGACFTESGVYKYVYICIKSSFGNAKQTCGGKEKNK